MKHAPLWLALAIILVAAPAQAAPPPPPLEAVLISEALQEAAPIVGKWESSTPVGLDNFHFDLNIVREYGAIYIRNTRRGSAQWSPLLTLVFDSKTRGYKLLVPTDYGYEVADVSHPDANSWQWIAHVDGPAHRTTLVVSGNQLRWTEDLVERDGTVKPYYAPILMNKVGKARLDTLTQ